MGRTRSIPLSELPAYARGQVLLDRKMARLRRKLNAVANAVERAANDLDKISANSYKEDSSEAGEIGALEVMLQKIASMVRGIEREPD